MLFCLFFFLCLSFFGILQERKINWLTLAAILLTSPQVLFQENLIYKDFKTACLQRGCHTTDASPTHFSRPDDVHFSFPVLS